MARLSSILFALLVVISVVPVPVTANHIIEDSDCEWIEETSNTSFNVVSIHGTSSTDLWASAQDSGTSGDVQRNTGSGWVDFQTIAGQDTNALFARTSTDVWLGAENYAALAGPHHYTGTTFTATTSDSLIQRSFRAIYAPTASDAWTIDARTTGVTRDRIFRWNGASWGLVDTTDLLDMRYVHGSGASNIWAVGGTNSAVEAWRWDGAAWSQAETGLPASFLSGVWVLDTDDAWAVGNGPDIHHWNGASWETQTVAAGTSGSWNRIYGLSGTEIWATGSNGRVAHYDGVGWTEIDTGQTEVLRGIYASSTEDVWVGGTGGLIVKESCHVCDNVVNAGASMISGSALGIISFVLVFAAVAAMAIYVGGFARRIMVFLPLLGFTSVAAVSKTAQATHGCVYTSSGTVDTIVTALWPIVIVFAIAGLALAAVAFVVRRNLGK